MSEDPLAGTGQKAQRFWMRIFEQFKEQQPSTERNAAALISRWNTIRADVSKFCGLVSKVEAEERSGWSPDMYIEETLRLWKLKDAKNNDFAYKHCWVYLKDKRKWLVEIGAVSKNQTIDQFQKTEPKTETPTRPPGQKTAKRRARTPERHFNTLRSSRLQKERPKRWRIGTPLTCSQWIQRAQSHRNILP